MVTARLERTSVSRRAALHWTGAAVAATWLAGCASKTEKAGTTAAIDLPAVDSADAAVTRLQDGNQRFVAGNAEHPDASTARRGSLAAGQQPFALVFSCVDSRVPPEIVFDQGLGDLFVARSAGQALDHAVMGSIQYGVTELKIPLLVVLGHEKCGAVKATVEAVEKQSPATGTDIDALVAAIRPAVAQAEAEHASDVLDAAVRYNISNVVALLGTNAVLKTATAAGKLRIVGARYGLADGRVQFL